LNGRRRAFAGSRFHELEIDLFFERIHLERMDDHMISQLDDAPGATPHELAMRGIEHEKLVLDR
jgi:hypothetical protein